MKKNIYFRTVLRRENLIIKNLFGLFLAFASYPRMILEVFIRKNFGQRYFNLVSALTVALFLFLLPIFLNAVNRYSYGYSQRQSLLAAYGTWYAFLIAFFFVSVLRAMEIERNPSTFDFGRFSLYSGDINPYIFKLLGHNTSIRTIEIVVEPALFFIIGAVLSALNQSLGILLILCSICYCISYYAAYKRGDDFVLDKIDEMIMNEDLEDTFVNDKDSSRGVRFYGKRPSSAKLREKLADTFTEEVPSFKEPTYVS